ncbi:ArgE/DapE family deacylase [Chloroflexota bacterium]
MNYDEAQKKVCQLIEDRREEIIQTLRKLVSIPSVVGQEGACQKYLAGLYYSLGMKVTEFVADHDKVSRHKAFSESGISYEGRPNIIGTLEGDPSARSLKLNGHVDVVSPEPVAEWDCDPWEGKLEGNRLYGRGAWDMKAGLIANYFALKTILDAGFKPKGTVMLESVIEEEVGGGGGALACLIEGFTADGLFIPEPNMQVTVATPGIYYFRVNVMGKTAHAGRAHIGVNAIGKMNRIYDALVDLDEKRARENHYPLFEQDSERSCHLNFGIYSAGDWASTVAGWAELKCRLSLIPGEKYEDVKNQVHKTINEAARRDEWLREHPPGITWFGWQSEPWEQDPNHPFVTTFKCCADKTLGANTKIIGVTWGLDTRFAQYFNIPALTFGPAGANIHGVNEYVEVDSFIDCTKVISSFIMEWCGV